MHKPPRILIVDDNETNRDILRTRLGRQGYELIEAADGEEAVASARQHHPDLILLDVMMPKVDGIEACRQLKADAGLPFTPIILVTAKADSKDVVAGLEAGADEYLTKPVDQAALAARVKSMLRIKELTDEVRAQAADLVSWNRTLEQRVTQQLAHIERMDRLKRFLSPQVAELILSSGDDRVLDSHRRDVSIVFCDLRGFTAFAETAEPEEVMTILGEYHACAGAIIHKFQGTIEHFAGDGLMAMLNDPLPCAEPCLQAVRMAAEMRASVGQVAQARLRARLRHRHRLRLRHARPHRLRGPLRLCRDRRRAEPCGAPVRRGEGRADPDRRQGQGRGRGGRATRAARRAETQGVPPADQGVQRSRGVGLTPSFIFCDSLKLHFL